MANKDSFTFEKTFSALQSLSLPLRCSGCGGPPVEKPIAFKTCGHSLCSTCSGGIESWKERSCPVSGCGENVHASDVEVDRLRLHRWEAAEKMRLALENLMKFPLERDGNGERSNESTDSDIIESSNKENKGQNHGKREIMRSGKSRKSLTSKIKKTERVTSKKLEFEKDPSNDSKIIHHTEAKSTKKVLPHNPDPTGESVIQVPERRISSGNEKKQRLLALKNLNKKNAKGETQLQVASIKGNLEKVKDLLVQGASPNVQDNAGWTPLHEASQRGFVDIVKALLAAGALPNVPGGTENVTPLHDGVASGCKEVVEILLRYGANKDAINSDGKTPSDFAYTEEMKALIDELEAAVDSNHALESSLMEAKNSLRVLFLAGFENKDYMNLKKKLSTLSGINFKFESSFNEDVTHVIFYGSDNLLLENGTTIYYKALLTGKWILTSQWLEAVLEKGENVDEENYEIQGIKRHLNKLRGPEKSRINTFQHLPRLFDGFHIYLQNKFSFPFSDKAELADILKSGGAVILTREPNPECIPPEEKKVPYHAGKQGPLSSCSHLIIYQDGVAKEKEPLLKYDMEHIKSLPVSWIFNCIHSFAILPPLKE